MNGKSQQLAERREYLIALVAAQRETLARDIEPLRLPLKRVDQGLAALRFIKRHPFWLFGGVALVAALRPGIAGAWLRRGWSLWWIIHKLRGE